MEHHVYFWLTQEKKSVAARAVFEEGLRDLLACSHIQSAIWGKPAATQTRPVTDQTWDYALSLRFPDLAAHDAYQVDPLHELFVAEFQDYWDKVQVLDVEELS